MDFSGTWKIYSEENLEAFLKAVGAPDMIIKMRQNKEKPVVVIEQKGDEFTYTLKTAICTQSHSFTLGKETEMTTPDGRKLKCTFTVQDGKLISVTEKYTSVREIQGDEMVETITCGSVTLTSKSKRV
ncbi:fatty acid-binding protein, liver [Salarias fasciatus]|uniref:Fatty acid-binding protein, liver-like n=1 Tax=Salarias fasciatus TaxID=181472 RepID=A0A672IUM7_SALFA|nr:fatty acid-binding protein, liver-like [Salarias fasciatus]